LLDLNLSHGAGETDDFHTPCAGLSERERGGVRGRAARVDVVDETDRGRHAARGPDGATDVAPSLGQSQAPLAPGRAAADERRLDRELPADPQLACEPLGGVVPALQAPVAVGGDERHEVDLGPGHGFEHQPGRHACESPESALLPASDEPADGVVVLDGRPGGREREPPAGALAAPGDGPDGGSAAPGTERRDDRRQAVAAPVAQLTSRPAAGEAALRQDEIEQASTLAGQS
jgi:hypothetical protein